MSWLHKVNDPFIAVFVHAVCGERKYEMGIRQEIQSIIAELQQEIHGHNPLEPKVSVEILPEGAKRCRRCKVVAYYGKSHQKADWKVHKKICVPKEQ